MSNLPRNTSWNSLFFFVLIVLSTVLASAAAGEVPVRTPAGQTLEVPEADFERGQIFYLLPGEDTQVAVTSTTPLMRTILTASRAVGYAVATFDPEESDQPILGVALRLPAVGLTSASSSVDGHLRDPKYLDTAAHPEVVFELAGAGKVERLASDDENVFAYRMVLKGRLTALGVTREIEMPAEVRFLLTTFETFARSVGDLLTIKGSFEVKPADFGWEMPQEAAGLVAPALAVDVFLLGSTMSPEKNLDPNVDSERWLAERRYLTLARDLGDAEGAAAYGGEYLAKYRDDDAALAGLARLILDEPGIGRRDLGLARRLLERAGELDADVAENLARLAELRGDPPAGE